MSKAVVLSGGGAVGIAWETGLVAGLAEQGVDLSDADFVLGTSAGSAVGAQLALGRDMAAALERFEPPAGEAAAGGPGSVRPAGGPGAAPGTGRDRFRGLIEQIAKGAESGADPKQVRASIGRFALEAETIAEDLFVRGFAYLQGEPWPAAFRCTAVDVESGRFKVWDAAAGVELVRAVASSCAVPGMFPPITLNGRRYMDGGMRTGTNADIATGHERVLIITLMGRRVARGLGGAGQGLQPVSDRELGLLRKAGAEVEVIAPDAGATAAMGMDLMNPKVTHGAAQQGLRQGKAAAAQLRAFWS